MSYGHRHHHAAIRPYVRQDDPELDALALNDTDDEFLHHHVAAIRESLADRHAA